MNKLILENGIINIEDLFQNNPSIQAILEDNVVTQDEKIQLSERITEILKSLEQTCNDEQLELVRKLLAEISALIFVTQMYPNMK
jgi:hypothetical protein